jgi:hypothetical protein
MLEDQLPVSLLGDKAIIISKVRAKAEKKLEIRTFGTYVCTCVNNSTPLGCDRQLVTKFDQSDSIRYWVMTGHPDFVTNMSQPPTQQINNRVSHFVAEAWSCSMLLAD